MSYIVIASDGEREFYVTRFYEVSTNKNDLAVFDEDSALQHFLDVMQRHYPQLLEQFDITPCAVYIEKIT